jgi:hypothetical protein
VSDRRGAMLVCSFHGERIGLVGIEVVATGLFEAAPGDEVFHEGRAAVPFDLDALVATVREGRWAV